MSINLFLKRRLSLSTATHLDDGCSVIYELRRPDTTILWTNAVAKVRRNSDNTTAFLFFDGNAVYDTISTSSLISTSSNTTPSATTFGTWLGANGGFFEEWIGITDDNTIDASKTAIQTTTTLQPRIALGGAILTKNGNPDLDFESGTKYLEASTNTDINTGNDYTIFTVSYSDDNTANQTILSSRTTSVSPNQRFIMLNDRRSNALLARIRSTTSVNYDVVLSSQLDSSNQRLLTVVVDGTAKDLEGFLNGVSQGSVTWASTYTNSGFKIGADLVSTSPLDGGIQAIKIFPSNSTNRAAIEAEMISYYSIP